MFMTQPILDNPMVFFNLNATSGHARNFADNLFFCVGLGVSGFFLWWNIIDGVIGGWGWEFLIGPIPFWLMRLRKFLLVIF